MPSMRPEMVLLTVTHIPQRWALNLLNSVVSLYHKHTNAELSFLGVSGVENVTRQRSIACSLGRKLSSSQDRRIPDATAKAPARRVSIAWSFADISHPGRRLMTVLEVLEQWASTPRRASDGFVENIQLIPRTPACAMWCFSTSGLQAPPKYARMRAATFKLQY